MTTTNDELFSRLLDFSIGCVRYKLKIDEVKAKLEVDVGCIDSIKSVQKLRFKEELDDRDLLKLPDKDRSALLNMYCSYDENRSKLN